MRVICTINNPEMSVPTGYGTWRPRILFLTRFKYKTLAGQMLGEIAARMSYF